MFTIIVNPMKTVAVLGASPDRNKFGNKAVRAFQQKGYMVFPINPKHSQIEKIPCYSAINELPQRPDLVTVYVPPHVLKPMLVTIAKQDCDELWLNPGTESKDILAEAERLGLNVITACSIRALGLSPSEF